jgi:acetate---CoA ligase (ADP-forming)
MSETRIDIARLIRPRSIAIVGISPEPGSPGFGVLGNLERCGYRGAIHLVSRGRSEVAGRKCVASIDELPDGVDLAMLMLPRAAIEESVALCARRGVGAAIVFAAGFGEMGGEWAAAQERFATVARAAGVALSGPNCLGLVNYVDGIPLTFSPQPSLAQPGQPAIAVATASGGLATILRNAFWGRGLGVTFSISTGNEAVLTLEDYLDFALGDPQTRVVAAFAEQIRRPGRFLAAAARARKVNKPLVLLHPGRSAAARQSAQSHTGALVGDHALIATLASHAGAVMVESLEEMIDVCELLARFPEPPTAGLAVLTDSGAFKGMTLDQCDALGLDLPPLSPDTEAALRKELPEFVAPSNPLDITAQGILHLDLYQRTIAPLLADPAYGSLLLAVIVTGANDFALTKGRAALRPVTGARKPVVFGLLGDDAPVPEGFVAEVRGAGIPFFRSAERGLRAIARVTHYARARAAASSRAPAPSVAAPPLPSRGVLTEHESKTYLATLDMPMPPFRLARDLAAAREAAEAMGFPVALKLQARGLAHKSDIGGVILGVTARGLGAAWKRLETLARRRKLALDGILVEKMAAAGLEAFIGARRDPEWGPALVVGLGGIWTEALADVRLLPADLDAVAILAELKKLKGARLFDGLRGAPARDAAALAEIAARIGALMRARPDVREIDLNPVAVFAAGDGALILDALIVAD